MLSKIGFRTTTGLADVGAFEIRPPVADADALLMNNIR